MTNQQLEGSFGYSRRLSPTRQVSFNVSGGATHVNTLNTTDRAALVYWTPSGAGSVSLDVGRSWSVSGNYDRAVQVLQGVSLTSFATDSAHVALSGLIDSRIEASLSAIYSNGTLRRSEYERHLRELRGLAPAPVRVLRAAVRRR